MEEKTLKNKIAKLKVYRDGEANHKNTFNLFADVIQAAEKWDNLLREAGKVGLTEEDFNKMVSPDVLDLGDND